MCGPPDAVLDAGGLRAGYVLHLQHAAYWRIRGITVRDGQVGIVADATSNTVIDGVTVETIGDEGVHLRSGSTDNVVRRSFIRRTGLAQPRFGEGVYVGTARSNWARYTDGFPDRSDRNQIVDNDIRGTGAESIDVKEGTTGGRVLGNVLDGRGMTGADSLIDVKGNDWLVQANVGHHSPVNGIETHEILVGWGTRNVFQRNTIAVDGHGYVIHIGTPTTTSNVVSCDNAGVNGAPLRTNVRCAP